MQIDKEAVRQVALLARLELSEEELQKCAGDLTRILEYVDRINAMGLENTEPLLEINKRHTKPREDGDNQQTLERKTVLDQAPESDGEYFLVPPVIVYPES